MTESAASTDWRSWLLHVLVCTLAEGRALVGEEG